MEAGLNQMQTQSLTSLAKQIRSRECSALEACTFFLDRIEKLDGPINAYHEVYRQRATDQAKAIDAALDQGQDPGPLAGVPIAVKDNIVTDYGTTTAGSQILEHFKSPYTATAVEKLEAAGAVILGKTNCDEFAMGSSTEHCAWGATSNPWDTTRVPGGSSGGSAAAVTAGLCCASIGSDTGGSIRQPAALCGVVGCKPSYGRVSRWGLIAFGSSLDQIGPFTHTVEDAAMMLQVMAGLDAHDSTSAAVPVPDYTAALSEGDRPWRLGGPSQYLSDDNDPSVTAAIEAAIEVYRSAGCEIIDVELPLTAYGISTYYVLAPAEASSNLARYDGIRFGHRAKLEPGETLFDLYARSRAEGFGPEVQRRIMLRTYVLSAGYYDAYYKRALQVRRLIKQEYDAAFDQCDALIGPTSPTPAFEKGAKSDPISMYLCDVYTANTNIAGICGISVPTGFAEINGSQLPIGLQIQCQSYAETTMFRIAHLLERALDLPTRAVD